MMALIIDEYVIQVVYVGRIQSCPNCREARAGYGAGRHALIQASIIRRIDSQVALGQGTRPLLQCKTHSCINAKRHLLLNSIVDDRGDLCTFFRDADLLLNDGSNNEYVQWIHAQIASLMPRQTASLPWHQASDLGVDPLDVLIVASILETEVRVPEERAKVASVSYNRSEKQRPLGVDATVGFALKKWTGPLTKSDLAVDSPYNTCLLYTSDAADDLLCVDLGGRRIIKKK